MFDREFTISKICLAVYVALDTGDKKHQNRKNHGFVLNDTGMERDYYFSDGMALHTKSGDFFYLPKGSDYIVNGSKGGCYAINFEIEEELSVSPFLISFRDYDSVHRIFQNAAEVYLKQEPFFQSFIASSVYLLLYKMKNELQKGYLPKAMVQLLHPAEEEIRNRYTDFSLSVSYLASICHVSEVYFRRIFKEYHGVTPQKYIARLRINRAKQLLQYERLSAVETARICGYQDPAYFSREFKKFTGIPPAQYGKENR